MATELPKTKDKDEDIVYSTEEKGWFGRAVQRVREKERTGKLDPDCNLTVAGDIFAPIGPDGH